MGLRHKRVADLEARRGSVGDVDLLREEWLRTAASDEDVEILGALADRVITGEVIPDEELLTFVSPIEVRYRSWREERTA